MLNHNQQPFVILFHIGVVLAQFGNGLDGVHHGGVVAPAECVADGGQRKRGELFGDCHGDLARAGKIAAALFAEYVADGDVVVVGNGFHDELGGDGFVVAGNDVLQCVCGEVNVYRVAFFKAAAGDDAVECAFQLAHVLFDVLGNKQGGIFG